MINCLSYLARLLLFKGFLAPFLRLFLGIKFRFEQDLSFDSPKIIVANHNSHIDAIAILASLSNQGIKKVHPVVARDYFYRNRVTKFFAKVFLNSVSVSRSKEFENPLAQCEKVLASGNSLIIFPEGARGSAGELKEFKCGVSLLLKKFPQAEFVPVYCEGLGEIMPKGDWLVLPFNASVQFGKSTKAPLELDVSEVTNLIKASVLELNLRKKSS